MAAAAAADAILKKGKRAAAAYVHGVCMSRSNDEIVNEIFDTILDPETRISDWESIDWCRWLLSGGGTPDEFSQTVRKFDSGTTCGLVWTTNFVAYRCRTCGISPCMSLCSACFQQGDHQGHDFNMFRSQAGGACDCGDKSVMRESGFCSRHGVQNESKRHEIPPFLLSGAEALMPRLFLRLVQHLRDYSLPTTPDRFLVAIPSAEDFLAMLQAHSEMGAPMRDVMTHALTNPHMYHALALECDAGNHMQYKVENLTLYLQARNNLEAGASNNAMCDWYDVDSLKNTSCFLDELVFWTIHFEFPQKLVCLLLNMMPDLHYKACFTRIFVLHYGGISRMLSRCKDSDTLSNRVVHVSVQLFSNEALALAMTQQHNLLNVMIQSMQNMMQDIALTSKMQGPEKNSHLVVDCSHHIMKEHCYWPLVSDLNNILSHASVAHEFLSNPTLIRKWFHFLSLFQGMNVNTRELKSHVEFESNTYYAAFSAELEGSATPMWALISHLKHADTLDETKEVISICIQTIQQWFTDINFSFKDEINPHQVSFHLPLHRCFASFLGQAVRQGEPLLSLLPSDDVLTMMMAHPLQAQVAFHEILCNMWVRSGLQIKGQAMTYIQCHFCNSIVDADLFLLQLCAMKLQPDLFLQTLLKRFHVWEWLTFQPKRPNSFLEQDKVLPMLEGALSCIATLLALRINLGVSEESVTRQEMVSLLCMGDRTHSQLMDLLPDKCGETAQNKNFEATLNQVADYRAPNFEAGGGMMQGTYVPKAHIWQQEFDPVHVLLRSVHRREYQNSLDRYTHFLRQQNKVPNSHQPWPPFHIPAPVMGSFVDPRRILHCKTMHGLLFTILHRAVNDPDIPEQVLSFCIYLLDMAIRHPGSEGDMPSELTEGGREVEDLKYEEWFDHNDTLNNFCQTIDRVVINKKCGEMEEMEVEEEAEGDVDNYTVHSPIVEEDFQDPSMPQASLPPPGSQLALPHAAASTSGSNSQLVPVPQTALVAVPSTSRGVVLSRSKVMTLRHALTHHRRNFPLTPPLAIRCCSEGNRQSLPSSCSKQTMEVGESMLSLLLQLHARLSEKPDSFRPDAPCDDGQDGAAVVQRLLQCVLASRHDARATVNIVRERLWPRTDMAGTGEDSPPTENRKLEKEERRRKAKERQRKLMAEFASKQKAFLQKTMETEGGCSKGGNGSEEEEEAAGEEYECVICSQMSASEEDRPVGMVVLLQATSVAGHQHETPDRRLPCEESEVQELKRGEDMAAHVRSRIDLFVRHFDSLHWPMALNIGWEGGVHVQSCGHYLHLDCHKAYIQSLKGQNQLSSRLQNLAVDQGEYYCPLCRQLANSVLPLRPLHHTACCTTWDSTQHAGDMAEAISHLLAAPLSEPDANLLKKYMGGIMEDLTNVTRPQFRSVCSPNHSSLFLFVCSIARTNLEVELIQRSLSTEPVKKKACFVPLLNVLSLHSCLLSQTVDKGQEMDYVFKVWTRLVGHVPEEHSSLTVLTAEVPLLLRDPIAILLQIVLTIPMRLDKAYYKCVLQVLYNFLFVQAVLQVVGKMTLHQRQHAKERRVIEEERERGGNHTELERWLHSVINHLSFSNFFENEDNEMDLQDGDTQFLNLKQIDGFVQEYCLHFLKTASLLQSHLYDEELPVKCPVTEEFPQLCQFLGLGEGESSSCHLHWTCVRPDDMVATWLGDFTSFVNKSTLAARSLLCGRVVRWHPPSLLSLPPAYDAVFKWYHRTSCTVCHSEPKDPSLCLACGTLVCLRQNCCRMQSHYEAVVHAMTCGGGTAVYLAVNSSTIIVIRGKRACLWGSVYLDCYGEEDRDLKRGKPLYLSAARYALLQQQWLQHSFDHTNKRWVWHKDNL